MSSRTCQHCGCSEIDVDTARGDAVCTNCGSVLEDNIIVSEVQFEESGHGGSRAIGQLVSAEGQSSGGLNLGFQHGMGKESRMITLQNARRKITQVAEQLRLNQHCIDTAYNFYKMALLRRITRGRRSSHVIAACVYMVCRIEGTPHMLLDLSDVVQVNVYELGRCYLALSTALCLNIPALDPALYIVRFAHRLELGDSTHEVSMTALRLVQRMKRDWIHTGRRPSGLCGAALLFASRLHNFNRTVKDVIKVVKVCENTVRKRLNEFGETPSAQLTLNEFMAIDLEEEQDPPCFKAARKKLKQPQVTDGMSQECEGLRREIEEALTERRKKQRESSSRVGSELCEESLITEQFIVEDTIETIDEFINKENGEPLSSSQPASSAEVLKEILLPSDEESQPEHSKCDSDDVTEATKQRWLGLAPTAASLGLKDSIEECMKVTQNTEAIEESGELDITGLEDSELDAYILTEEEVSAKTNMWNEVHAEYLEEQRKKEEQRAKEEEENAKKPEQKKKKRTMQKKKVIQASTAGEAIEKMLQEKKISSKINYDVLKSLNSTPLKASDPLETAKSPCVLPQTPTNTNNSGFSFFSKRSPSKISPTPSLAGGKSSKRSSSIASTASGGTPPSAISGLISSIISNQSKKRKMEDTDLVKAVEIEKIPDGRQLQQEDLEKKGDLVPEQDLVEDEDEVEDEEEPDDNYLSVAQLLGQHRGEDDLEEDHYDYDEYS